MLYNLHTHNFTETSSVIELVNKYPYEVINVPYFSTGIHPWYIDEDKVEEHLIIIEQRLKMNNCLALGECGLDKRVETSMEVQMTIFEKQLLLAKKNNKPVVLHLNGAFQELIAIKNKLNLGVPMIIHGFSKDEQLAKQLLNNGFHLSFGKYLLSNPELSKVLAIVPQERFFLETDTIEESINDVYKKAALARNTTMNNLLRVVEGNFKNVFDY
ncbi:MAG: hydrolase TatD [Flavobacterium sp. MedPE-SWcel]|uniref:TatD family hydrolase n=1 Tax=uncultured Flavobacterium sp. TaxID=165435 RepID=UPI00091B358E|nr:TatD family hydrolase [uncultured Flavobacterium sp.]OIQ20103.1 MAG: hydrolase TatD [Flavobacterium sp. MedPE-SWcel]